MRLTEPVTPRPAICFIRYPTETVYNHSHVCIRFHYLESLVVIKPLATKQPLGPLFTITCAIHSITLIYPPKHTINDVLLTCVCAILSFACLAFQTERAFQKQANVFLWKKGGVKKSESRWCQNPGLGFKIPREVCIVYLFFSIGGEYSVNDPTRKS